MKTGLLENKTIPARKTDNPIGQRQFPRAGSKIKTLDLRVSIEGNQYLVDFGQSNMSPRFHKVNKNKECSCGARFCEAIEAVRQYLQAGGLRAPDLEGMPPCPICGGKTNRDRNWDGKFTRTLGWRCQKGGLRHFLEAKAERIKHQLAENPWLIPPVPGYPGVRRDEVMTWAECQTSYQRASSFDDDPMI